MDLQRGLASTFYDLTGIDNRDIQFNDAAKPQTETVRYFVAEVYGEEVKVEEKQYLKRLAEKKVEEEENRKAAEVEEEL